MEQTQVMLPFIGATKQEIATVVKTALSNAIESGEVIPVAEALSAMENLVKQAKESPEYEAFRDAVRDKVGKSLTTASGAKIESCETGTKYHYDKCGDPVLARIEAEAAQWAALLKERQSFLQNVPKAGQEIIDTVTGEAATICPPYKTSVSSFKITLAK